ncbi:MAG: hypothetical protein AAF564_08495 [Bacteroidota bacterium]
MIKSYQPQPVGATFCKWSLILMLFVAFPMIGFAQGNPGSTTHCAGASLPATFESKATGDWNKKTTWNQLKWLLDQNGHPIDQGGLPKAHDIVKIKEGHVITFDATAAGDAADTICIEGGGNLTLAHNLFFARKVDVYPTGTLNIGAYELNGGVLIQGDYARGSLDIARQAGSAILVHQWKHFGDNLTFHPRDAVENFEAIVRSNASDPADKIVTIQTASTTNVTELLTISRTGNDTKARLQLGADLGVRDLHLRETELLMGDYSVQVFEDLSNSYLTESDLKAGQGVHASGNGLVLGRAKKDAGAINTNFLHIARETDMTLRGGDRVGGIELDVDGTSAPTLQVQQLQGKGLFINPSIRAASQTTTCPPPPASSARSALCLAELEGAQSKLSLDISDVETACSWVLKTAENAKGARKADLDRYYDNGQIEINLPPNTPQADIKKDYIWEDKNGLCGEPNMTYVGRFPTERHVVYSSDDGDWASQDWKNEDYRPLTHDPDANSVYVVRHAVTVDANIDQQINKVVVQRQGKASGNVATTDGHLVLNANMHVKTMNVEGQVDLEISRNKTLTVEYISIGQRACNDDYPVNGPGSLNALTLELDATMTAGSTTCNNLLINKDVDISNNDINYGITNFKVFSRHIQPPFRSVLIRAGEFQWPVTGSIHAERTDIEFGDEGPNTFNLSGDVSLFNSSFERSVNGFPRLIHVKGSVTNGRAGGAPYEGGNLNLNNITIDQDFDWRGFGRIIFDGEAIINSNGRFYIGSVGNSFHTELFVTPTSQTPALTIENEAADAFELVNHSHTPVLYNIIKMWGWSSGEKILKWKGDHRTILQGYVDGDRFQDNNGVIRPTVSYVGGYTYVE